MSERRDARLRTLYEEGDDTLIPSSRVSTAVIRTFEKDLRYLLDKTEHDYADGEMAAVRRRLRRVLEDGL